MTIREKLADWISGGALSEAKELYELTRIISSENYADLCRKNENIRQIANATASGKSGTAKKIHRMATEALTSPKS